jgi:long-chain acyl-CoA synthetase
MWKLANKLVYSKVREAFGGRVRIFVSGGAPLGIDTARWFASAGIALWEGYGLTETSPVIALNTPIHHRMGSAGMPLPNVELKLAEDGELLVRGPRSSPATGTSPPPPPSVSIAMDGFAPATSPLSTPMDFSTSPIARRNC